MGTFQIQVMDPSSGQLRMIYVYDGIEQTEFKMILETCFSSGSQLVGFRDERGIHYPFSAVIKSPRTFIGICLSIIFEDSNISAVSNQTLNEIESDENLMSLENAKKIFDILDLNMDNKLHKEEFIELLTLAFEQYLDYNPRFGFAYSCLTPKDIALATSINCYRTLEANQDSLYYLKFPDFSKWYFSDRFDPLKELMIKSVDHYSATQSSPSKINGIKNMKRSKSRVALDLSDCYNDEEIHKFFTNCRKLLKLSGNKFPLLFSLIQSSAEENQISREMYTKVFFVFSDQFSNSSLSDDNDLVEVLDLLFDLLGPNSDDEVGTDRLILVLCLVNDKFDLEAFKISYEGYMEKDDNSGANDCIVFDYLCTAFHLLFFFNEPLLDAVACRAEDLAQSISTKMLLSIDVGRSQRYTLDFQEFMGAFLQGLQLGLEMLQVSDGVFKTSLRRWKSLLINGDMGSSAVIGSLTESPMKNGSIARAPELSPTLNAAMGLEESQVKAFLVEYQGDRLTVPQARHALGLSQYETADLVVFLRQMSDSDGYVAQSKYRQEMARLVATKYMGASVLQRSVMDFILDRTFSISALHATYFNPKHSAAKEKLSKCTDLICALLLFGEEDVTVRAELYVSLAVSASVDGQLHTDDAIHVVAILLKTHACLDPSVVEETCGASAMAAARELVGDFHSQAGDPVKATMGLLKNAAMSRKEFVDLMSFTLRVFESCEFSLLAPGEQAGPISINGAAKTSTQDDLKAFSSDEEDDEGDPFAEYLNDSLFPPSAAVLELRAASDILGLESYSAEDMMESLGTKCQAGRLDADAWFSWLQDVAEAAGTSSHDSLMASQLGKQIFGAFSVPYNESPERSGSSAAVKGGTDEAYFAHVVPGLAFLCGGSPLEERIMVAFTTLDSNCDGKLTKLEFQDLILSTLTVISLCSRMVANKIILLGAELTELAEAAAKEALHSIGLTEQDLISLEEMSLMAEDFLKLAVMF